MVSPCRENESGGIKHFSLKGIESFVTNSDFLIPIFVSTDGVNLCYFKVKFFYLTEFIV